MASNVYNKVFILKEGYSTFSQGSAQADCTITLIQGKFNILVDTGNAWDKDTLVKELSVHKLTPSDIDYLVCTHGHSDHTGNLNLFTEATHIVSYDIHKRDAYVIHGFKEGIPYEIDDSVEVIPTPGHSCADVSVVVRETPVGTVVVAGDLFENGNDLNDPQIWQDNSYDPELQQQHRLDVLKMADYIIPGHGPMFKVPDTYTDTDYSIVMLP